MLIQIIVLLQNIKKEIDLAYELKPLIWNPSPQEMKYLNNSNVDSKK